MHLAVVGTMIMNWLIDFQEKYYLSKKSEKSVAKFQRNAEQF